MHALEQKAKMTYGALAALGQAGLAAHLANPLGGDDQAQENQESYKGAVKRYGKRCLAFIGDPDSKFYLLVWKAVGSTVMAIRYRFFKHCTWHSHSKDDVDRLRIVDFCPGPEGRFFRESCHAGFERFVLHVVRGEWPPCEEGSWAAACNVWHVYPLAGKAVASISENKHSCVLHNMEGAET